MDNQEFFDLYMADTTENLRLISQTILHLESDPTNEEYIQEMFRAAHSIKGSAGQMQFYDIANVTHKLEDLFGAIRDKKIFASPNVIDIVLKTLDCLELLHEKLEDESLVVDLRVMDEIAYVLSEDDKYEVKTKEEPKPSFEMKSDELSKESRFNIPEVCSTLLNDTAIEVMKAINLAEYRIYYIHAVVDEKCDYKGVRMFMFLEALANDGEVISTSPSAEEFDLDSLNRSDLDIILVTDKDTEFLNATFHGVLEVEVVECTDISFVGAEIAGVDISTLHSNNKVNIDDTSSPNEVPSTDDKKEELKENINEKSENKKDSSEAVVDTNANKTGAPKNKTKNKGPKEANLYVRVHTKTLDTLLNEQGELLLEYNRLCSVLERARKNEIPVNEMLDILDDVGTNINKINNTQQSIIMSTRMFPLEQLFSLFPRMVRDLSSNLNKQIALVVEGQDTELDRTILEKVSDPLKHIIRNAVDHGIEMPEDRIKAGKSEKGTITLSAKQESDSVIVTVKDDGKGMDPEVLKKKAVEKGLYTQAQADKLTNEEIFSVIFMPGFSTASVVTEVSGRGVGMDIVRSSLSEIGGVVLIDSKLGEGTTFTVKIPLTLAISKALLVTVEKEKYIILLNYIQEVTEVNRERDIKRVQHRDHIVVRGQIYPLVYLRDVYNYPEKMKETESVILISNNGRQIGLVADSFLGQQDIVVKSLNKYFGGQVKYEAGITKLGDGSIPIIVDVPAIMENF